MSSCAFMGHSFREKTAGVGLAEYHGGVSRLIKTISVFHSSILVVFIQLSHSTALNNVARC